MKSCVLITSHLNNQAKIDAATNLIDSIQDKNLPIIFTGNYPIPESIQKKVNWALYTKENPTANRIIYGWGLLPELGLGNNLYQCSSSPDYGYAHLLQAYRGFKLAKSLEYEHVIHFNYDVEIDSENWNKLITQVNTTPNVVFSWKKEYATNIYTFLVNDFIEMCDEYFPYYVNNNPPDIHRKDWFCEAFFRWICEKSLLSYFVNKEIKINSNLTSGGLYWKYGSLTAAYFKEKNMWLLTTSNIPPEVESLNFEVDTQVVKAKRIREYRDGKYFLLPHIEGEYFFEGNLIFNSTTLKLQQWVEKR